MIGEKTKFRPIEVDDLPSLAKWLNDPALSTLVVGWSFPVSLAQEKRWFERLADDRNNQRWMVDTHEGQTIGLTGLWQIDWQARHALTALKIGEQANQGKGHGSDAIMLMMAYAFQEVNLNRLWGEIVEYNVPSYKAYVERCGWKVEGVLRRHVYRAGKHYDVLRVGILREEFYALPRAAEYVRNIEGAIEISSTSVASEVTALMTARST